MTAGRTGLAADWLTIVQSEIRALAEDREVREAQAAVLDRLLDDAGKSGAPLSGANAAAGAASADAASGACDGDAGGGENDFATCR